MIKSHRYILGCLCAPLASANAASPWQLDAGVGAFVAAQPWQNTAAQQSSMPIVMARYQTWRFGFDDGNVVSYGIALPHQLELRLGVGVRDDGYDGDTQLGFRASKAVVFQGYQSPNPEAIVSLALEHDWFKWQWSQQANQQANASQLKLQFVLPLWQQQQQLFVRALLGPSWQNQHYLQRLYGITNAQQDLSVGRSSYTPAAAWQWEATLQASYILSAQWHMQAQVGYRSIADSIKQSPLVDASQDGLVNVALMVTYHF